MGTPCQSACSPWADLAAVRKFAKCAAEPPADDDVTDWLAVATDVCFELSGQRWPGSCKTTVRPGRDWSEGCVGFGLPWPVTYGSGWPDTWWREGCACNRSHLSLGVAPVTGIETVKLDGAELVAGDDFRVDDFRHLVRLADADGNRRFWPCFQRIDLADTEVGTLSVTFTYGAAPPPAGVKAVAALACNLARAAADLPCDLEPRATQKARQGVTVVLQDPTGLIDRTKDTGIAALNIFLRAYAADGGHPPAAIVSPDVPMARWAGT